MKKLSIEEKAKSYDKAILRAKALYAKGAPDSLYLEEMFPELRESEDKKIRKELIDYFSATHATDTFRGIPWDRVVAWLEKQVPIDKEKVQIGARKDIALSIMNFLDRNTLGMCLSNLECKDLEDAVVDSDWSKVYDYMKNKLEKQGEQKSVDKPKFKVGDIII